MIWKTRPRSEVIDGIALTREGQGPPVLMIHGVGLCADAWNGLTPLLIDCHEVISIDLPGHGKSNAISGSNIGLRDYTRAISPLMDSIAEPVAVVGHSMGAMIALDLASRHGEQLAGIVALNAIFRRTPEAAKSVVERAAALKLGEIVDPGPTLTRWFGENPSGKNAEAREACRDWLQTVERSAYAQAYGVFATHDAPDDRALTSIGCPALFMTGENEPNSTPEMSQTMARIVPDGECIIVENAAHMMPMTHTVETAGPLKAFLSRCWRE